MDQYDYKRLVSAALAPNATQSDIDALGEWFHAYDQDSWNGEYYHVDATHQLYPIYREVGYDDYDIVGYTFSSDPADRFIMRPMTDEERAAEEAEEREAWKKARKEAAEGVTRK